MVDLHNHLLHGLDDGAVSWDQSLEMAEMAARDGITHIACTPHANSRYSYDPELNAMRRQELAQASGARLVLAAGCDLHFSEENVESVLASPGRYTLNGGSFLLVELPDLFAPMHAEASLRRLIEADLTPIVTHPERNRLLCDGPERLQAWVGMGCLVQVTAGSYLGRFGKTARRTAEWLADRALMHVLATDAHNTTSRPPCLSEARAVFARKFGEAYAKAVTETVPRAIFDGTPLPEGSAPERSGGPWLRTLRAWW